MAAVVLLIVSLLHSVKVQGSENVFVKSGSDLILDVEEIFELTKERDFFWKRNTSTKILKLSHKQDPVYFDKNAEVFVKNHSLLLKNVQPNNSGVYTAVVSEQNDKVVAKYFVTVQDPVSPVSLSVTINSFHPSCNVSVTCRTSDSEISQTFTCNKTCSPASAATLEKTHSSSYLDVYLDQDYVICNHSNQVSSSQDKTKITSHCQTVPNKAIMIGAGSGVLLICLLCAGFIIIIKKCKRKSSPEQTVYEVPQNVHQTPNEYDDPAVVTSDLPTSTYALVQFPTRPQQQVETPNSSQIETVYSQVNRAAKSKSAAPTANH